MEMIQKCQDENRSPEQMRAALRNPGPLQRVLAVRRLRRDQGISRREAVEAVQAAVEDAQRATDAELDALLEEASDET